MSNQTRYAELGYRADAPNCWRIVSRDDGKSIGPQYKSKGELLADLDRYAAVYGCTKEDEQRSELATLACALAAEREKTAAMQATLRGMLQYVEDGNVVELRPCGFVDELLKAIYS